MRTDYLTRIPGFQGLILRAKDHAAFHNKAGNRAATSNKNCCILPVAERAETAWHIAPALHAGYYSMAVADKSSTMNTCLLSDFQQNDIHGFLRNYL
jgi:hypothetical protein